MRIKKYLQILFVLSIFFIASVAIIGASIGNVAAEDKDNDGLDDDWEGKNGYDNDTAAEKVLIYEEKEEWDKAEKSNDLINVFLFVLLLSFGIFSLLAGIFTAYFGAGKSRAIGGVLLVLGLVVILVWVYFGMLSNYPDDTILGIVHWEAARTMEAVVTVVGAIIGAVVAIVLFLVAIMKS